MKRRDFFKNGFLTTLGLGALGTASPAFAEKFHTRKGEAKNIIFLVSDGMSHGTLNMANILMKHKLGRTSSWITAYEQGIMRRGLMDTQSANSWITDSAAAGSAWGGGMRVNNGALNVGPNGERPTPILQKFKAAGKAVGCVTSVTITHATPAAFCVNSNSRNSQPEIAVDYLDLRFDVMMGGGANFFAPAARKDERNLFKEFSDAGFHVARTKAEMLSSDGTKPLLGVFSDDGLPYAVDRENDPELKQKVPSLAEMTRLAIQNLSKNPNGFVMQVEGGKVDWAAHANDAPALIYDQVDFDEALAVALDFAAENGETLVVATTDHGNANPGLFYGSKANENFEKLFSTTASNEWVLNQITQNYTPAQVIELIEAKQRIVLNEEDAKAILSRYNKDSKELYNPGNLPFADFAAMQAKHTNVQWAGTNHSADHVELAMFGPGAEAMPHFMENYRMHQFLLEAAGVTAG